MCWRTCCHLFSWLRESPVISRRRALGLSFPFHLHCCRVHCEAFSEELIHPGSLETGAPVTTETDVSERGRSPGGWDVRRLMRGVCVCVRSRWGRSSVSIWSFSVSLDLLSQLRELNTFHFFCFIISVLCAGVKSFHVRVHMLRKRQLDSHKLWADYETITLCTDLSEHPIPACCSWLYFTGQILNIKSDYWHIILKMCRKPFDLAMWLVTRLYLEVIFTALCSNGENQKLNLYFRLIFVLLCHLIWSAWSLMWASLWKLNILSDLSVSVLWSCGF